MWPVASPLSRRSLPHFALGIDRPSWVGGKAIVGAPKSRAGSREIAWVQASGVGALLAAAPPDRCGSLRFALPMAAAREARLLVAPERQERLFAATRRLGKPASINGAFGSTRTIPAGSATRHYGSGAQSPQGEHAETRAIADLAPCRPSGGALVTRSRGMALMAAVVGGMTLPALSLAAPAFAAPAGNGPWHTVYDEPFTETIQDFCGVPGLTVSTRSAESTSSGLLKPRLRWLSL